MKTFFHPKAVAVVGASTRNLGYHVVQNLINGYDGDIYPINANYETIEDLPCYPSLAAVNDPIDMAIVLVPAAAVPGVLEACGALGIQRVIIESAGFAETGESGRELQRRCVSIAAKAGIRLWGPNCMGIVDVRHGHFFTFMHPSIRKEGLLEGRISLIVQSGMMSAVFLAELARRGIGVSKACSIGNRADVDECDVLEYLLEDPDTDVVAMYLESIPRGERFVELARNATKPLVVLKGGRSEAGARAAKSHTYSLSGNARLLKGVLETAGVILVDDIFQMMDVANSLTLTTHLKPAGRAAIITLSGGAGILACDALDRQGLPVAELSEKSRTAIGEIFPPWMPVSNPVDLFPAVGLHGRMKVFMTAISAVLSDANVDLLVIHIVVGLHEGTPDFKLLKKTADQAGKVVFFWLMGRRESKRRFREQARAAGIPVLGEISRITECLKAAADFKRRHSARRQIADLSLAEEPEESGKNRVASLPSAETVWDEFDSKKLLADWQIPVVSERCVSNGNEALDAARKFGFPVVAKGLLPGESHKTELGLVKIGIRDPSMLEAAVDDLLAKLNGGGRILIQKQAPSDYELIAGFLRDPQFGPCLMFGIGGIFSEVQPDVVFAPARLDPPEALALIDRIRSRRLLDGFRGIPPLKKEATARLLIRLGRLGMAYPRIEQIDINPLLVSAGDPLAVDATVILSAG